MVEKQINLGLVKLIYENLTDEQKEELTGEDGVGLDFTWDGTQLGIKKTTDEEYQYQELKQDTIIYENDIEEVIELIKLHGIMEIVDNLPNYGEQNKIYLTPVKNIINDSNPENITYHTLNDYYTKTEVDNLLNDINSQIRDITSRLES